MDPDRIDLSALDPGGDALRWERYARATVARAIAARAPTLDGALARLARDRRLLFALAAAAVLAWVPALRSSAGRGTAGTSRVSGDTATQFADWASRATPPDAVEVLQALRELE